MGVGHRTDRIDRRAISRSIVDRAADRDALCIVGTAVLVRGGRVLCDSSPQRWTVSGAFGIARCAVTFLTEDSSEPRGGRKLDPLLFAAATAGFAQWNSRIFLMSGVSRG